MDELGNTSGVCCDVGRKRSVAGGSSAAIGKSSDPVAERELEVLLASGEQSIIHFFRVEELHTQSSSRGE